MNEVDYDKTRTWGRRIGLAIVIWITFLILALLTGLVYWWLRELGLLA